ncbi:MAG: hypothetical protein QW228_00065 [Candidatus Aenigmatarchaeota archaeon]
MKAQISFVEFLTAMTIFLGAVTFVAFQVSSFIPNYLNELKAQRLKSEIFQISELLINDPGYPIDWYKTSFDNVKKLGLSDETKNETNLISGIKMKSFFSNCSKVGDKIILDHNLEVTFKNITGSLNGSCSILKTQARGARNFTISRIVAYTDGIMTRHGELVLSAW